jgi:hypothetical protein
MKVYVVMKYHAEYLSEWEMLQAKFVDKIQTHFVFNFFRKSCRWWDNVEKYGTVGQAKDDNTAHVQCTVNN